MHIDLTKDEEAYLAFRCLRPDLDFEENVSSSGASKKTRILLAVSVVKNTFDAYQYDGKHWGVIKGYGFIVDNQPHYVVNAIFGEYLYHVSNMEKLLDIETDAPFNVEFFSPAVSWWARFYYEDEE